MRSGTSTAPVTLRGFVGHRIGVNLELGTADAGWHNVATIIGLLDGCDERGRSRWDLHIERAILTVDLSSVVRAEWCERTEGGLMYAIVFPQMPPRSTTTHKGSSPSADPGRPETA